MAEFRATREDLAEVIRRQQRLTVRQQARYSLGALIVAALFLPVYPPAGWIALGMGVAWSLSTYWAWQAVTPAYLWRYAWLQEGVVVDLVKEGVRFSTDRGSSLIRWSGGVVVRSLPGSFVLEDEGEDLAVLPKKYLDSTEILILQSRVAAR